MLLRRALNNLVANAISYTDTGGEITLMAKSANKYTEVSISDNGIGINPAELSKIFDRFYRADKARTKNTQGSGLGLSLVKSIINLHQGTVTVKSEPGVGTTVILRFPTQSSDME
jgi:signal transduction histidine kinase